MHSPSLNCPFFARAAQMGCPCSLGAGAASVGPSSTPQRRLLPAVIAHRWAGMRSSGGGASCLRQGCPHLGTRPPPTAHVSDVRPGLVPFNFWHGYADVGTCHQPHSAPSNKVVLRDVQVAGGRPGVAPCASLSLSFRHAAGARCPVSLSAGRAGVRSRHRHHSARSCKLALHAVGLAGGCPAGGASAFPGLGTLRPPGACPSRPQSAHLGT